MKWSSLVKIASFVVATLVCCSIAFANPCAGKGTKVVFVNGLMNDETAARDGLKNLASAASSAFSSSDTVQYDLAWVEGEKLPIQLARAALQRGVDDFQRFWLWSSGIEKAPDWFDELVRRSIFDAQKIDDSAFPRLKKHLELYSETILQGYELVVVSYSVGNFYANTALRLLPNFISTALQPSILERTKENPYYPKMEEMVANVQIATPVAQTVNQCPWISFKDDSVLNLLRKGMNVLPGNVDSPGISAQDVRGHSLIPSYLRVDESRNRIIEHIRAAHARLRHPIPFFEPAATVQYDSLVNGMSAQPFSAAFFEDGKELTEVKETASSDLYQVRCMALRPGDVVINGETTLERVKFYEFHARGYAGMLGQANLGTDLKMRTDRESIRWTLGHILATKGLGKDPMEAKVSFADPVAKK